MLWPRRSGKLVASNVPSSPSIGSATPRCGGGRAPDSTRARHAMRSPGRYSFIASVKSVTAPSKINDTGLSGVNLAVAAVILWNTVYLGRVVDELRSRGEAVSDDLIAHIAPLGWEHIALNGDYVWPTEPLQNGFRPLRNPRSTFLDAA